MIRSRFYESLQNERYTESEIEAITRAVAALNLNGVLRERLYTAIWDYVLSGNPLPPSVELLTAQLPRLIAAINFPDDAQMAQAFHQLGYLKADIFSLAMFILGVTEDSSERAALRAKAVEMIEASAAWSRSPMAAIKTALKDTLAALRLPQVEDVSGAKHWSKTVTVPLVGELEGKASVFVEYDPSAAGLFVHFHYGSYGAGFRLTELEAAALLALLAQGIHDLKEESMTQNRKGFQDVGMTPMNWYAAERAHLDDSGAAHALTEEDTFQPLTEAKGSPATAYRAFAARLEFWKLKGYVVQAHVSETGEEEDDAVEVVALDYSDTNLGEPRVLIAEVRVMGIPRSAVLPE